MATDSLKLKSYVVTKPKDPTCSRSKPYHCRECLKNGTSKYFPSQARLNKHVKQCHCSSSLTCGICFKSFQNLPKHQKTVHMAAPKFRCSICHRNYKARASLQEHMFTAHKVKKANWSYSKCDLCFKEFTNTARLEAHVIEKHVVDKEFECSVCTKKFIDLQSLDRHKNQMHKSITKIFSCDVCSAEFALKRYLRKHFTYVHPSYTFCLKCERSFITKLQFNRHIETNPKNSEAFKCHICQETCTSQCNFDWHAESHVQKLKSEAAQNQSGTKNKCGDHFECELCFDIFETELNLFSHQKKIHRIRRQELKCNLLNCSQTFGSTTLLRRHKLGHHSMERAICDNRRKSVTSTENLETQEVIEEILVNT